MSLTTDDLERITAALAPRFDQIEQQLIRVDKQLIAVRGDIENLAAASAEQFAVVDHHLGDIKTVVADYGYRITLLEHKLA